MTESSEEARALAEQVFNMAGMGDVAIALQKLMDDRDEWAADAADATRLLAAEREACAQEKQLREAAEYQLEQADRSLAKMLGDIGALQARADTAARHARRWKRLAKAFRADLRTAILGEDGE